MTPGRRRRFPSVLLVECLAVALLAPGRLSLGTGETPLASFMLIEGQCAVPTPRAAIVAISSSVSQIAWASAA